MVKKDKGKEQSHRHWKNTHKVYLVEKSLFYDKYIYMINEEDISEEYKKKATILVNRRHNFFKEEFLIIMESNGFKQGDIDNFDAAFNIAYWIAAYEKISKKREKAIKPVLKEIIPCENCYGTGYKFNGEGCPYCYGVGNINTRSGITKYEQPKVEMKIIK